ncbi:hypothetical protein [Listeria booriae]|uniref:hypothetical protein n=1 Tax=Listeria booriae TaxID=1552123 RepID=UPI001623280A|nr:hypothetical protein [Listeria booriae]MBC1982799.1 hypothetical protein [Listeria booriae]MBC2303398.1 hypothetical protein [Listeria booriae]
MNKCRITVYTKKGSKNQLDSQESLEQLFMRYSQINAQEVVSFMDDKSCTVIPVKSIDYIRIEKLDGEA